MLEERECYVYLDAHGRVSWPRLKTGTSEQYVASRKLYFGRTDNPDMLFDNNQNLPAQAKGSFK